MNSFKLILKIPFGNALKSSIFTQQIKYSSYKTSAFVCDLQPTIKYEVTKDPSEWVFVEQLLPPETVPKPTLKTDYISNWKPQTAESLNQPYFIKRSRNHMLPVYLLTTYRGMRRLTRIRHIEGDIWQLEKDLKAFLQPTSKKPIRIQVNEFAGFILVHGDHVNAIKHWLQEKHF